ncbi:hypothetical protein ACIPW4_12010 [Pseudomonas sp. NPDC089996]|uniref:hypothetical protein n=1 Tax=Pseudomonas sp. NPDC089996 TaxID=3364474 RepID=UPI00382F229B
MGLSWVIVVVFSRPLFSVVQGCSLSNPQLFSCSANLFSDPQRVPVNPRGRALRRSWHGTGCVAGTTLT